MIAPLDFKTRNNLAADEEAAADILDANIRSLKNLGEELSLKTKHHIDTNRENTRTSLGKYVIVTFCAGVAFFIVAGLFICAFEDESHTKSLIGYVQVIGSIITPIASFVMGHYFANKEK